MVAQLRSAVIWLSQNAASLGGDPERIHVIGHSSGAHLTSVLLTTDWPSLGAPDNILKSGVCVSGMYELRPVMLSARSAYVKLSSEEEDALSAIRHLDRVRCPIIVAYGDKESPELQRQGREFAAALRARGLASQEMVLAGCNHFEGIRTMMDRHSPLARAAIAQTSQARLTAEQLYGTWKLLSNTLEDADGQIRHPLGEHPKGYLTLTPQGRFTAILAAEERKA